MKQRRGPEKEIKRSDKSETRRSSSNSNEKGQFVSCQCCNLDDNFARVSLCFPFPFSFFCFFFITHDKSHRRGRRITVYTTQQSVCTSRVTIP